MPGKVSDDVIEVLAEARVDGNNLYLPGVQLERKLYVAVDNALKALGGKWTRGVKAHVFPDDPAERIEQLLQTGEYIDTKKEFQFFETPSSLAQHLVGLARIVSGETVLEPSAGRGAIARHLPAPDVIELNADNRKVLAAAGFNLVGHDFLKCNKSYDVIVANPPFSRQQDIDHVLHALALARRCVVSVMSASVLFRNNNKTVDFRNKIELFGGAIVPLPDDSFYESGTGVRTCVVVVDHKNG